MRDGKIGYHALIVFLSAFLLFQIQPLIGKLILPWFGGTPAVWSASMLVFQALLLAGYAYAYGLVGRLSPRKQGTVHLALLTISLALMLALWLAWGSPIIPGARWKPLDAAFPQWQVLRILVIAVGLPYFVLSANGPLMQAWFGYRQPDRAPYHLYALSNAGSLLGLVTYPFAVEPVLALRGQANLWACGYVAFVLCAAYGVLGTLRLDRIPATPKAQPSAKGETRPGFGVRTCWVALSACASVLMLATTHQLTQEITVTPFLWVLPLALYLLSFILCFSGRRWYFRTGYTSAFVIATILFAWVFYFQRGSALAQVGVYAWVLFVACMICHGELASLKPHPRYLTSFYLLVAAGGVLGGIGVSLIVPRVSAGFWELPLGLLGCWMLLLIVHYAGTWHPDSGRRGYRLMDTLVVAGIAILGVLLLLYVNKRTGDAVLASRDFYGVVQVKEADAGTSHGHVYTLVHNGTRHGFQYLDAEKRRLPTAYYTEESGMGLAILNHPRRDAGLRIGAVGLGVGVLAAYGRPTDTIRFYEINPTIIRLAEGDGDYFTFLSDCAVPVEIVPGDARVSLERELAAGDGQRFDLLVVDAFSGGSIPVHLLTREAFALYLSHLAPDGVIALHISNHYLDLRPVVQGLADHLQLDTALIVSGGSDDGRAYGAMWMLVTGNEQFLAQPEIVERASPRQTYTGFRLWTDDYSSVFQVLSWGRQPGRLAKD